MYHECGLGCFNHVHVCATLWTIACQATLFMGFSRQEYWSGLPFPLPGDRPRPGIEPVSLMSPALAGGFFTTSATWRDYQLNHIVRANKGLSEIFQGGDVRIKKEREREGFRPNSSHINIQEKAKE